MKNNIVILGAGESGIGAALLAYMKGYDVFVSDGGLIKPPYKHELEEAGIAYEEGQHTRKKILKADVVIKSPGISDQAPIVQEVLAKNIKIIDELEFASGYTNKPIVAITGSNGKTTTTLLAHHLLSAKFDKVGLAGNVGQSLAKQVIKDDAELYVVEVSSFQLDGMSKFRADIAVLLNITPDHLDRYNYNFDEYAQSKMKIASLIKENGILIYCGEDEEVSNRIADVILNNKQIVIGLAEDGGYDGYQQNNELHYRTSEGEITIPVASLPIKGPHNRLNALVAMAIAAHYGMSQTEILAALESFKNAPHRLEFIANINGVDFINDSKATNVEAVRYALGSFDEPIVWIAGGQDKGNDYSEIKKLVAEKVKALVCLGADNQKLYDNFAKVVEVISMTDDVSTAANMALEYANKSDVVLFSPACASFDLFNNYAERGDLFKAAVEELKLRCDA